jgi:hypothetical protein
MATQKTRPVPEKKVNISTDELEAKISAIYEVPFSKKKKKTERDREIFFKAFGLSISMETAFLPIIQNPHSMTHPRLLRKFVEWIVSGNNEQYLISSLINFSLTDEKHPPHPHDKWRVPYELNIPYNNKLLVKFPPFNPSELMMAPAGTTRAICRISICIGDLRGNKLFRSTQEAVIFYLDNELSYETEVDFNLRMEKGDVIFVGMSLDFRNEAREWTVKNPDQLPSRIVDAIYIE